jgi:hypothetical protein
VHPLSPFVLALTACATWPRYEHLPVDSGDQVAIGQDSAGVEWTALGDQDDEGSDDDPRGVAAESLPLAHGNYVVADLAGTGWLADAVAARPADCGSPSGFPPDATGDYAADVDWRLVNLDPGVLCSVFAFDGAGGASDVLVYTLDACDLPLEVARLPSGDPLGADVSSGPNVWTYPVLEPVRVGVVAASRAPDAPDTLATYRWGLALMPAPETGDASCPAPPGVPVPG